MNFLLDFNVAISLAVLVHAMCVINQMGRHADHVLRTGYILLAVGAAAVILGPLYGYSRPPPAETLLTAGAALVILVGHWRRSGGSYRGLVQQLRGGCALVAARLSRVRGRLARIATRFSWRKK